MDFFNQETGIIFQVILQKVIFLVFSDDIKWDDWLEIDQLFYCSLFSGMRKLDLVTFTEEIPNGILPF